MIGVIDSGVGGLSVYQAIKEKIDDVPIMYVADSGFAPYGEKRPNEITARVTLLTQFLKDRGATMVVLACNTATVIAIDQLREVFPDMEIVGTEPPLKMALQNNAKDRIGIISTEATAQSEKLDELISRVSVDYGPVSVVTEAMPQLVEIVEEQKLWDIETEMLIRDLFKPLLDTHHINSLVIGCTHFSFVAPMIQRVIGTYIPIFDAREGVANQVRKVYLGMDEDAKNTNQKSTFFTTGSRASLRTFLQNALDIESDVYEV